ncbi:hypothetical protein Tco_0939433 [Tanacetum coccineum]|uniref:Tf2-1-like SH3-like domain-containing protein n=1 Tax=Tanacetum coccineum TaxID=301880 RepID=A0ABQ5DMM1_9ASTR
MLVILPLGKKRETTLRVRALVMTIGLDLPKQILNAQTEARKPENIKNEDVGGVGLPVIGDLRTVIMHESPQIEVFNPSRVFIEKNVPRRKESYMVAQYECLIYRHLCCKCLTCAKVKAEHQRQSVAIFLPMKETDPLEKLARMYLKGSSTRHGIPVTMNADLKRKPMEFEVGDKVMLKVSPWKGVVRFGKRGKLNPRFVGPFKVIKRVGDVAYKLELPEELSRVHNTFHVSNLKKCHADEPLAVPLDGLHFDDKLQFVEEPIEITDREVKRLKRSRIPLVKVRWNSKRGPEFTWEREDQFRKKYPHLFTKTAPSSILLWIRFQISSRAGRRITSRPSGEVGESSAAAAARRPGPTIETRLRDTERRMMTALAVRAEIEVLRRERLAYEAFEATSLDAGARVDSLEDTSIMFSCDLRKWHQGRLTRLNPDATPTPVTDTHTTTSVTSAQLQAMIDEGVTAVLAARATTRNGDDSHTSGTGVRRNERAVRECTYQDFMKCQPLFFRGTEGVVDLT